MANKDDKDVCPSVGLWPAACPPARVVPVRVNVRACFTKKSIPRRNNEQRELLTHTSRTHPTQRFKHVHVHVVHFLLLLNLHLENVNTYHVLSISHYGNAVPQYCLYRLSILTTPSFTTNKKNATTH